MCGICGFVSLKDQRTWDRQLLGRMAHTLAHRGPDDEGFFLDERAGLASRRLSIVDLAGGHQPMFNEAGTVCVVFNGEIYNQAELRGQLSAQGHVFATRADTEVIVHLYEEYGDGCVTHLNGMFALAVWDSQAQRGLLARDRLGVKPLFYTLVGQTLVFASEIKAFWPCPDIPRVMDLGGLDLYLTLRYLPADRTIFKGIHKLLPGHVLQIDARAGTWQEQGYWHPVLLEEPGGPIQEGEIAEELLALLEEAVRIRLMSDVPFGAFLSGGLDSSGVVALMSRHMQEPVKTFSIGFSEQAELDERQHACLVAQTFATEHYETDCTASKVELLPRLLHLFDEPFADPIIVPTYQLAQLACQHVKVVLTGEGADEVFGGYTRFAADQLAGLYQLLPAGLRRSLSGLARLLPVPRVRSQVMRALDLGALPAPERFLGWVTAFGQAEKKALYRPELQSQAGRGAAELYEQYASAFPGAGDMNRMLYCEMKTRLPECMLARVDRMTMGVSLEGRTPFLDYRLVERVLQLPARLKVRGGNEKYLLKRMLSGVLPPAIVGRRKQGLAVPFALWTRYGIEPCIRRILSPQKVEQRGLFNPAFVQGLLHQWGAHQARHSQLVWSLLCLEVWCRVCLDSPPLDPETPLSEVA